MRDILSTVAFFSLVIGIALFAWGYFRPLIRARRAYNLAFAGVSFVLGVTQVFFAITDEILCALSASFCFYFGTYRSLKNLKPARSASPRYRNPKKRKFWQKNKPKKEKDKKYKN